jgi:large conductance mechanosensitive channel
VRHMVSEFREFLLKQNALALAVGVVVGGAIGKVVTGIVDDVLMPIIGVFLPEGGWRQAEWVFHGQNSIKYGDLIGRLVDFIIVASVVFMVVKLIIREKKAPPPDVKTCTECLEPIPRAARRCRACTAVVA